MAIKRDKFNNPIYDLNRDAFSRLRVSNPTTLFDDKHLYSGNDGGLGSPNWIYSTSGTAVFSHNGNDSSVDLTIGIDSGDYISKQSRRYFPYIPGKSQLVQMTGVFDEAIDGRFQAIGQYDDNNGIFFCTSGDQLGVVIRSDASGSVVDRFVSQNSWNGDRLDGSLGPCNESRQSVNPLQPQIFVIDYQWLAVGAVRMFLVLDGEFVLLHQFNNANNLDLNTVYMRTSTLPLRSEIRNYDTTVSSGSFKAICSTIISEGGEGIAGLSYASGNASSLRTINTREPIYAIRMLDAFGGKENRVTLEFLNADFFALGKNTYFEVVHVTDPTSVDGTWTQVCSCVSAAEESVDLTIAGGGKQVPVATAYVPASTKGNTTSPSASKAASRARNSFLFLAQNYESTQSQMFVVYATSVDAQSTDVGATLVWEEIQ